MVRTGKNHSIFQQDTAVSCATKPVSLCNAPFGRWELHAFIFRGVEAKTVSFDNGSLCYVLKTGRAEDTHCLSVFNGINIKYLIINSFF